MAGVGAVEKLRPHVHNTKHESGKINKVKPKANALSMIM
jgi:hypothetical protein